MTSVGVGVVNCCYYYHHNNQYRSSSSSQHLSQLPSSLSSSFTTTNTIKLHRTTTTTRIRRIRRRRYSSSSTYYQYLTSGPALKFSPPTVMQWQDCTVKMEIDVPISVAYQCYSDREAIPRWMPFISSVKILDDKPDLSRWSLKYKAFGRDINFSWIARNMQPILNQKIHWRSMEGLPNRGAVRFFPKSASSCLVELTVSYEVPQLLTPVASALQPFLESLLMRGLERFATFAKTYTAESTT